MKLAKKLNDRADFRVIYEHELITFDMYFASLCSMQVHPGAGTKEHKALSIDKCKEMAIDMLIVRRRSCLGSVQ